MTKMLSSSSGRTVSDFIRKRCEICRAGIIDGYYYDCTTCEDYQLCLDYEKDNDRLIAEGGIPHHDPDHVVIKCRV